MEASQKGVPGSREGGGLGYLPRLPSLTDVEKERSDFRVFWGLRVQGLGFTGFRIADLMPG